MLCSTCSKVDDQLWPETVKPVTIYIHPQSTHTHTRGEESGRASVDRESCRGVRGFVPRPISVGVECPMKISRNSTLDEERAEGGLYVHLQERMYVLCVSVSRVHPSMYNMDLRETPHPEDRFVSDRRASRVPVRPKESVPG